MNVTPMNTTSSPYSHASLLYANTDFSKLSWLETQWAAWYLWIGNPVIATGLMSFLLHEVRLSFRLLLYPYSRMTPLIHAGCLFRPCHSMDHYRRDTVFQAVEVAAE